MKKILLAAALALSACTTPLGGVLQPQTTFPAVQVAQEATDALSRAADGYAVVAQTAARAVSAGVLTSGQRALVRTLNDQAQRLLHGADSTLTVGQRAASLELIVKQLHSIVG